MRNLKIGLILFAILSAALVVYAGNGRQVGNPANPDAISWYGGGCYSGGTVTGCEVAIDYNGNLMPTTANTQTLGTSALPWSTEYTQTSTNFGTATQGTNGTANALGTGNATGPSAMNVLGELQLNETVSPGSGGPTWGLYISSTIPVISGFEVLTSSSSSAGGILVTSTPSISTRTIAGAGTIFPSGFVLVLTSTVTTPIVLQDQGTLAGSQLALGAATRSISKTKTLTLIWEATIGRWLELAYGNNQGN